ncbi:MAG: NAD(P)-dependent alcohol dehydrogenase, partial [Aldersonia sp.]|nr:NAD(P)-dependent alcohol dehydrogenase [Aldersonia sp.]
MRAVVHERYGKPNDVLMIKDVEPPILKDNDVLVGVRAAGVHVGDLFGLLGQPLPLRVVTGLRRPTYGIPGLDVAGEVEAVGAKVTRFQPGDEVFGVCGWPAAGAVAEYSRTAEDHLVAKPSHLSFEEAAAVPTSALAALHGLRAGGVRPGHRVLINGASGGVGTFAIQIAKALGAEVTGVCGTSNLELVKSLGANHAIDYTRDDFTARPNRYDVILDNIENRRLAEVRRALTPKGTLVLNSGTGTSGLKMLRRLVAPLIVSPFVGQRLRRYLSKPTPADLAELAGLIEDKSLQPVVERAY